MSELLGVEIARRRMPDGKVFYRVLYQVRQDSGASAILRGPAFWARDEALGWARAVADQMSVSLRSAEVVPFHPKGAA